jgi:hypothetical protein
LTGLVLSQFYVLQRDR